MYAIMSVMLIFIGSVSWIVFFLFGLFSLINVLIFFDIRSDLNTSLNYWVEIHREGINSPSLDQYSDAFIPWKSVDFEYRQNQLHAFDLTLSNRNPKAEGLPIPKDLKDYEELLVLITEQKIAFSPAWTLPDYEKRKRGLFAKLNF